MGFETGLYGQEERVAARESAIEESRRDVEGEHAAYCRGVRTELHYRKVMARLVLKEMDAVKDERELRRKYLGSTEDPVGFLGDFLLRVCNMPVQRQADCLRKLGRVANQMQRDGWHILRVFTAINCAVPMALNMRRDMLAKREQGDAPRSRVGRSCSVYRVPPPPPGSVLHDLIQRRMSR